LTALASAIPEIWIVHRLGLATINLYTKYEVSKFAHYKDMKGDKNANIGVVWGIRGLPRSSAI